jgi:hypothetical protein
VKKSTFFHARATFFNARITFFHAGRCSVKKSNFSVKKILFFTLASMKKSRFGKEKLYMLGNARVCGGFAVSDI